MSFATIGRKWWETARREMEKGWTLHRAAEKNRAGRLSSQGNIVAGPLNDEFSRGERFEGARGGRQRIVEERLGPD